MDSKVTRTSVSTWEISDLLGRSLGSIEHKESGSHWITPQPRAFALLTGAQLSGHRSLDAALREIERATRGQCHVDAAPVEPVENPLLVEWAADPVPDALASDAPEPPPAEAPVSVEPPILLGWLRALRAQGSGSKEAR